jgi:phosphorylcholine metabolism protein LicD
MIGAAHRDIGPLPGLALWAGDNYKKIKESFKKKLLKTLRYNSEVQRALHINIINHDKLMLDVRTYKNFYKRVFGTDEDNRYKSQYSYMT